MPSPNGPVEDELPRIHARDHEDGRQPEQDQQRGEAEERTRADELRGTGPDRRELEKSVVEVRDAVGLEERI
jgi:hypothetical protein